MQALLIVITVLSPKTTRRNAGENLWSVWPIKSVEPSHTSYDGDTIFVLSNKEVDVNIDAAAMIIIQTIRESIVNAVKNASELFGFKSVGDLQTL